MALVQESAPLRDGHITRVETLGGKFLYAINVYPAADSFNLCPADVCQTHDGVELARRAPAPSTRRRTACGSKASRRRARSSRRWSASRSTAQLDVGGIEYLVDDRDGKHYFYDINALSNFVADAPNVVGFDPFARLVDYLRGVA